jgi:hypothetical protein
MKEVPLRFLSLTDLSEFAALVGNHVFLFSRDELVLCGDFSDAEIELAMYAYDASIVYSILATEFRPFFYRDRF